MRSNSVVREIPRKSATASLVSHRLDSASICRGSMVITGRPVGFLVVFAIGCIFRRNPPSDFGGKRPPCFGPNRPPVSVISPTRGSRGERRLIQHQHLHCGPCDDGQGGWDAAGEIGHATHQGSLTAAR